MFGLYYVSLVDHTKFDIVGNFFNKEIEFTIVQLVHRLFRVDLLRSEYVHNVCLRPRSHFTFFWSTFSLQQVITNSRVPCPPPPLQYSTECHYVCCMTRITCTHINSCSSCRYNIHCTLLHASLYA